MYRERRQANIDVPLDAHAPGEQETEEEPPAQKGKKKNTDAVDTDSIVKELNQLPESFAVTCAPTFL